MTIASFANMPQVFPANATDAEKLLLTQVTTNCRVPDTKAGANKGIMCRSAHYLRADVTKLAIVLPTVYMDRATSKLELPAGGGITYGASLETADGVYAGTFKFDGQQRTYAPDFGFLTSDLLSVALPAGTLFWIRVYIFCPSSATVLYSTYAQSVMTGSGSEKLAVGSSEQTDLTLGAAGWSATASGAVGFWPCAIISPVSHKSVLAVGDSIVGGIGDSVSDNATALGIICRGIAPNFGHINLGNSGDQIQIMRNAYRHRLRMSLFTRNAVCEFGVNDIAAGRTLAQIQADMYWLWTTLKNTRHKQKTVTQTTITPSVTSTDSFATLANQTAATNFSTAGNGTREQLNDWLRDGAPVLNGVAVATGSNAAGTVRIGNTAHPLDRVWDVADQVESARNSGKFKVDGTANKWTADGIHPTQYGYLQVAGSAAITTDHFQA